MEKLANEKNMKGYGLVSIIMPNWNCAALIGTTIKTVLAQTYENWELLIQDDCSTDNPEASIKDCCDGDPRIKFERNKDFSGAAVSRNNALRRATGRWIAFSDDLWEPEKLEKQLKFMVENNYHFSYTGYQEIDNYGKKTGCFVSGPKHVSKFGMYSFCWPGCLTVMYERETVGLLQIADIRKNNDYAMWLKICQVADCHLLDEVLAMYRRGRVGSVSTHSCTTMIKWHYKLWHDAMGKNLISSTFWTGMNLVCGVYKKLRYVKRN